MLSYQHGYHAGNPADLHKHMILAGLLARLTRKPRAISYLETHAGRGLYDLSAPEALKTGEAATGIGRVALPDGPLKDAVDTVRDRHGPSAYPGSPMIARQILRPDDRIALMELHPAENAALKRALGPLGAEVHRRDGYEGVLALSPPRPRKGLVLVDPSYEIKSEYESAAAFALKLVRKWPEASLAIWYPILPEARHTALLAGLRPLRPLVSEVGFDMGKGRGMTGSGMALVNAPFGSREIVAAAETLFD
ncbi:23S rRNA (adenine(2030)-N(6))-methyltransferase RlmJ [Oceanomicrobium pacificus]|uniref:Ribosomal RNA large subunit methyltransferase J n=1 Tax=Oceanomicrobium pacificus TaxID=2692916 RepID=A0A6B0TUN4_9RHOB|nr:23S rRNA (adenine(2030)-N(6))-methyltransferase RlmJ [Oceanomicrobium pacificus]MXU65298.1 23S rRNA (adenine(2030)-N(6))-methyltransferase RlmJ [Oceanomicrobium pacificus]